jgi:hypothetical protein
MSWRIHDKEFESVMALPPPARYEYFVKRVADWEAIWSLGSDEGYAVMGDDDGHELLPVWPHELFAAASATGDWTANKLRRIDLDAWMERWLPGLERDGRMVAVFPSPNRKGVVVPPERLRHDLQAELSRIE